MIRIGNTDYPNTFHMIVADHALAPVWVKYCDAQLQRDNHEYLMAMLRPIDPRKMYEQFIATDSQYQLNVGYNLPAIAHQLAEADEWESPSWFPLFSDIRSEISGLLKIDHLSEKFWKHNIFLDHHVRVNQGNEDDRRTQVDDPVVSTNEHAARVLGLAGSPALKKAIASFEKEDETQRTLWLFSEYLKQQDSTMSPQDAVKILLANGQMSAPKQGTAFKIAAKLRIPDIRLVEEFYRNFSKIRTDGHAIWKLVTDIQTKLGKTGTPANFLRALDKAKLLPPHADPLAPDEEYDIPPAPPVDEDADVAAPSSAEDIPPPPPPLDEDIGDLPSPPAYGHVEDYPDHIAAIEQLLPGGDKAKLTKAFKDLKAAMVAKDECPPDTPFQQIASEAILLVKAKRKAAAAANPDADRFPDDDDVRSDAGSNDGNGPDAGAGANDGDTAPSDGGAGASPRQVKTYLQREVANIAGMLGNDDNSGARDRAVTVSQKMGQLGGPSAAIPAKDILSAARDQLKKNSASEISALDSETGAAPASGQIKLTNTHASNADWAAFAKHYCLGEEDIQSSRLIAIAIVKNSVDSPKALAAAKKLVQKLTKDKSAKFKFKNHRHLVAAVLQLITLKANSDKLLKPLKASDVADTVSVIEDA